MARISRTNSVSKTRIQTNYVRRNKPPSSTGSVTGVDPVRRVENNVAGSSANTLLSSDSLYDKLFDLKEDYLNFYQRERELEKSLRSLDKEDLSLELMRDFVLHYNQGLKALEDFDRALNTDFSINIRSKLQSYSKNINKIGLRIIDKKLYLIENVFLEALEEGKSNPKVFEDFFNLLADLRSMFRSVQGPYKTAFEKKYPEVLEEDSFGVVFDSKG